MPYTEPVPVKPSSTAPATPISPLLLHLRQVLSHALTGACLMLFGAAVFLMLHSDRPEPGPLADNITAPARRVLLHQAAFLQHPDGSIRAGLYLLGRVSGSTASLSCRPQGVADPLQHRARSPHAILQCL